MWEHQLSEYFQISFDMDIYSCFLAISILKISDAVFSFQCPVQSHWKHRADNICGSNSSYFCLYDKNNKTFVEFCRDHPDFEAPGKKIIVEGSTQETLQGAKCSSDFYQPFKFVTNGSYGCVLTKSYCNEEGQVVYGYGTTKNDTLCRCDYTRGYYFTIPPKQTCYCVPSEEDCSCHLKLCPPNYNLTQDYECLKVTERNTSFYCESIHSVVLPKDSEILLSTNNSSLESYVLVRANMQCVRVVVLVLVLIISVIILISCVVVLLIQKDYSNRMKHLDSIKAEPDSQSLPANMQNIDNGVCHPNITCDICGEKGIHGLRWKCCDCHDFDMCSPCYMADKHDLKHAFVRVDTPNSTAFNVPTRSKSGSNKKTAKGIFPNAEVMRGPHWKWKNDDGGEGGVGLVKALETWGKDSYRGAVKISWKADNLVKNYRVGGEGCVDVIYTRMTETASGGNYYADHLPFVDVVNPGQILLKIGDKVVITLPLKGFRQLQDNQAYGGWDDDMNQCLEETGTIVGFLYNGMSVKVQYEDSKTWVINKVALTRKHTFTQGDPVTILDNYNAVKELQKGHGGWNDEMKTALGKNGRIVRLDSDGDMRIKIGDKTWIFNPACIMPIDDASTAKSIPVLSRQDTRDHSDDESETGSEGDEGGQAVAEAIAQLFVAMLREGPGTEEENDSIVEAAAKGEFDVVKKIVKKHPDKINTKMEGKTALQLACYEGHSEIVEFLVKNKADVNIKDSEGDPALHYAAYGKESKILQVLLDNKATVNAVNAKKQSALHIAVNKGQPNCCKVLVDKGCDPNLKDDDLDTAMHDAISQKDTSKDILKYVLGSKMAKFTTENSRGFNVLHWAVLKDNKDSVEMIIGNDRTCVNSKMKDGSTAMHIAAANDRVEIASVLQSKGNADMNIRDSMKRTPLILAVSQGKKKTMELLITVELQEILQYWRNKLQRFVVTKAVELVYERIQTKQVVAIIGPTGTGKSVYAYKVAFRLSEEHGYKIIPAKQPADITRYFEKGAKQVFVIDDIVGKYDFDEAELVSWETLLHNVLNNNEQIKVILTGRKSFWHPENCERLRFAFVCDLHSNELSLTLSDRRNIYEAYLESSDINALNKKIIEMYPFLPSLCSTYSSKDVGTVEDFFTYPIQFIEEEIDNYKKISPVIYISLAMLAFEENIAKNLSFVNIENEELMKSLFLEFGSQILPSKGLIVSQLEALTDTYVKIDNDCFEFIHVEMKAIVLYCVAKTFMNYVLKYSKKTVIRNQVTLAGITCIRKEQTLPVIKVTPEHEEAYFTRLAGDLIEGQVNCFDILENNQNDFPIFREQFLVFLNSKKRYIKKRNAVGSTVLHVVSSLGYGDYVSYFINFDKGMIDEKDANGNVPLHLACMYGRLDIVELLAVNGRNIHMLNYEEISPFFYACEKNHISVVNFMIKLPDAVGIINTTYTSEHRTVLHIACLKGFTELTRILLNHHANVDVQHKNGLTPLHLACRYGKWDTASLLLKFRANVNALDELERTPMYYSCTANHKDIVELLIQNKADIDKSSSNGLTPLHAACEKESIDIVKLLIEKGSDVDAQEKTGERPLHLACRKGNEQTVKLLIDNKASINAKTINKMTPFHEACKNGHTNVVDILLKKNVKYNHKNNQGWTGLFFSCENGNNDVVDMILKYKTDVNRIDKNGVTALHVACTNSHTDIVSTLLKKNAKVNLRDNHGKTPLYISCLNNDIEIVKILCRNGADVNIFGNSELNPITIAQEKGFRLILEELNKVKK